MDRQVEPAGGDLARSPKRQNSSLYDRVRSKLCRSLSSGSTLEADFQYLPGQATAEPQAGCCTHCTLVNAAASRCCAACHSRPPSTAPAAVAAGWDCPACTYGNAPGDARCGVCGAPRAGPASPEPTEPAAARRESELESDLRAWEEQGARQTWKHIVEFCKQDGEPFVDDSFPPAVRSLYYAGSEGGERPDAADLTHIGRWHRLTHFTDRW
ncbi:calpain-15-like [Pollicipes pollicipes]|uniref:calpain-15-like n=1 Tax=Pollicipes pollicipes TaxID=41117 RepID=UPI0018850C25|nr:calpain-15-like [Pollicipes pollicipes]